MIHKHFYYQFTDHVKSSQGWGWGVGMVFSTIQRKITSVSQKILKTFSA